MLGTLVIESMKMMEWMACLVKLFVAAVDLGSLHLPTFHATELINSPFCMLTA